MTPVLVLFPMLSAVASATPTTTPLVESVGEAQDLGIVGNWARAHPIEDDTGDPAWVLTWAEEGDLWAAPLVEDDAGFSVESDLAVNLTGDGRLIDHDIEPCPDGSYLHVASLNLDEPDDSAWSFVYDADFVLQHSGPVDERNPTRAHNDMAVVCAEDFRGVTFPDFDAEITFYLPLDETGAPSEAVVLDDAPVMTGGSLVQDPLTGLLTAFGFEEFARLAVAQYDADYSVVRSDPVEPKIGTLAWWPQGLQSVGDGWLSAYLSVPKHDPGRTDDVGDIWITAHYHNFFYRSGQPAAAFHPPDGAARPNIGYRDGRALVTYDADNRLYLHEVSVDPTGDEGTDDDDDGGVTDTGWGSDTGDGGTTDGGTTDGGTADGGTADGGTADGGGGDDGTPGDGDTDGGAADADGGTADGGASDDGKSGCSAVPLSGALALFPLLPALIRRPRRPRP